MLCESTKPKILDTPVFSATALPALQGEVGGKINGGSKISENYLLSWLRYGLAGSMGRVERADSVVLHTYAPPMTAPEIDIEICCEH